jgi:hypothetical protein
LDLPYQKTMTATEFKAKCLEVMDQLTSGQLKRVIVTKHGKDVMLALPSQVDARTEKPDTFWGCMKDVTHVPDNLDLTAPLYTDEELDEFDIYKGILGGFDVK